MLALMLLYWWLGSSFTSAAATPLAPTTLSRFTLLKVNATEWNGTLAYGDNSNVTLLSHCAGVCAKDPDCHAFDFDAEEGGAGICRKGKFAYSAEGQKMVYVDPCRADPNLSANKSLWTFSVSGRYSSIVGGPEQVADGELARWPRTGEGYFISDEARRPWIQIEFGSLLVVKGATIWGRYPLFEARFTYLEVRVGNQSVEGSGGEERLCENQLCHNSGQSSDSPKEIRCSSPLIGQLATVQKYQQQDQTNRSVWYLEITEIEVIAQIHGAPESGCPGYCKEAQEVDHCNKTTCSGTLMSLGDKSSWSVSQSSSSPGGGPTLAIDGQIVQGPFVTITCSSLFSWFQVDLGSSYDVVGVKLHGRQDCCLDRFNFLEVRVGQTDVSGSEPDRKLCQNSLCYTVANDQEGVKDFSCPSVLPGRFVTVQKYAASPNVASTNAWCLELNEVEVTACV